MSTRLLLAGILVILAATWSAPPAAGQQLSKPTVVECVHGDGGEPMSLADAVNRAEAVLVVRILSKAPTPFLNWLDPVKTDHSCLVLDVVKGPSELRGQAVVVRRSGGTREEPDRIRVVIDAKFSDFQPGEEYVLLTRRYDASSPLEVGAPESYQIRGNIVFPMSKIDFAEKEAGQSMTAFCGRLRQLVNRRP